MFFNTECTRFLMIISLLINLFEPTQQHQSPLQKQQQQLHCEDIETDIKISHKMNSGGRVKKIFRGTYKGDEIVLTYPVDKIVLDDFTHGLEMLIAFQGSGFVPELIGFCRKREELKVRAT